MIIPKTNEVIIMINMENMNSTRLMKLNIISDLNDHDLLVKRNKIKSLEH